MTPSTMQQVCASEKREAALWAEQHKILLDLRKQEEEYEKIWNEIRLDLKEKKLIRQE